MTSYEFWEELNKIFNAVVSYQEKSIEFNNRFITPWIRLGNVFDKQDRGQDTVESYKKAIQMDPKNAQLWFELGSLYLSHSEYEEALQALQRAVELNPNMGWAYSNLGAVYTVRGDHERAIDCFEKSIELMDDPKDKAVSWNRLGNLYRKAHKYNLALQAFQHADELDVKNATAFDEIGTAPVAEMPSDQNSLPPVEEAKDDRTEVSKAEYTDAQLEDTLLLQPSQGAVPAAEADQAVPQETNSILAQEEVDAAVTLSEPQDYYEETSVEETAAAIEDTDGESTVELTMEYPPVTEISVKAYYAPNTIKVIGMDPLEAAPSSESPDDSDADSDVVDLQEASEIVQEVAREEKSVPSEISDDLTVETDITDQKEDLAAVQEVAQDVDIVPVKSSENLAAEPDVADQKEELVVVQDQETAPILAEEETTPAASALDGNIPASLEAETPDEIDQQSGPELVAVKDAQEAASDPELDAIAEEGTLEEVTFSEDSELEEVNNELAAAEEAELSKQVDATNNAYEEYLRDEEGAFLLPSPDANEVDLPVMAPAATADPVTIIDSFGDVQMEIDIKNAKVWNELGNVYYNNGALEDAIVAYAKSIELDREFAWPYSNLALVYVQKDRLSEAILLYQRAIELFVNDKDKAITLNNLGNVYRRMEDYPNAISAYQRADELDPNNISSSLQSRYSLLGTLAQPQEAMTPVG